MKRKFIVITAFVMLAALIAGGVLMYNARTDQQAAQTAARNRQVLMRSHAPSEGKATARVQIVEFFDPACGTCAAFYPMVKKILEAHPDDIRLSLRYAPFHPGSDQVVKMLEASRQQGKFWPALEALLSSQPDWVLNHHANAEAALAPLARTGLNMDRLQSDMQSPEVTRVIEQDMADANTLEVTQTPEYFVNGRPLPSFGFDQLVTLINEELAATAK